MNRTTTLTLKPVSLRASLSAMLLALFALILWVTPALAAVPIDGIVYEGKSVPGVALGDTRSQVAKSYGDPVKCNDNSTSRSYTCSYKVGNGGTVTINFTRNFQSPTPDRGDIVSSIRWSQELDGWTTTAGVTTKLALANPKAVVEAYPQAAVKYNSLGEIIQVRDARLGIQVDWLGSTGGGDFQKSVTMAIFSPVKFTSADR